MVTERRRDRRLQYRVGLVLHAARREIVAQTQDVSFNGILVRTDTPLPLRGLVRLRFTLPSEGDQLEVMGMVARSATAGASPGAGIQFYGLSLEHRQRWNRFIRFVAAGAPDTARAPAMFPRGTPDTVRRQHPRCAAALQVHVQSVNDLQVLYMRNLSKGGLFLGTPLDLPAGTPLRVSVIHPKTGEQFPLDAVVRWRAGEPDPGLGLEFIRLSEQRREEFYEFTRSEIPVQSVVFVPQGDPRLAPRGARNPAEMSPALDMASKKDWPAPAAARAPQATSPAATTRPRIAASPSHPPAAPLTPIRRVGT
jgi:Tfp pilus assembly protein PilZ